MTYISVILIALGGALGAVSRHFCASFLGSFFSVSGVSLGILLVNLLGCFLLGMIIALNGSFSLTSLPAKAFFVIGFLGSFTTLSAFSMEFWLMIERNQLFLASGYLVFTCLGAIFALWLGLKMTQLIL